MTSLKHSGLLHQGKHSKTLRLDLIHQGYVPETLEPKLKPVYLLGEAGLLSRPIIGIVGSRHASPQGMADSFWFVVIAI